MFSYDKFTMHTTGGILPENQAKYDVIYYDLNLKILSEDQAITGSNGITLKVLDSEKETNGLSKIEIDLIDNFDVSKIVLNGLEDISFEHENDKLWVFLPEPAKVGETLTLTVFYSGRPVEAVIPPWIGGFNWSKDSTGADWIGVSTQGEGGKIWFPCKDHGSDEPDSASINITIPENLYCASNGLLRSISEAENGYRTFHWFTGYPINNYNITLNIGRFERIERTYLTETGTTFPVYYYYLPESSEKADQLLDMAVDMLYTYRKFYGEYPWSKEKFAIVETDYLGMEHQTINSYGNRYNFSEMSNGEELDWLMLHEMGHEWWGNKVTVADLADFWIQEGICSYGEALYQLDKVGEEGYNEKVTEFRNRVQNKAPVIPRRNATSAEAYQGDIYSKGAYLMHSLRFILGDSIFFKTLKTFATDSAYTYKNMVSTDDFIELITRMSGKDLSGFFQMFLYTTTYPEIHVDKIDSMKYQISIPNIEFSLPMEIETSSGMTRENLNKIPLLVESTTQPLVDEKNWYLKSFPDKNSDNEE